MARTQWRVGGFGVGVAGCCNEGRVRGTGSARVVWRHVIVDNRGVEDRLTQSDQPREADLVIKRIISPHGQDEWSDACVLDSKATQTLGVCDAPQRVHCRRHGSSYDPCP